MTTGGRIKAAAQEKGINLHQLAVRSGIPYNTVYSIVARDAETVKWETLEKLATALNTTPTYLQGWDSDPSPILDPEIRSIFVERCKHLDEMDPVEIKRHSGDETYFKKFIEGKKIPTEKDLFDIVVDYDVSLAYLTGLTDNPKSTKSFENHDADPIDMALVALQIRKMMQSTFHIRCYVEDAERIASLIFDLIGQEQLIDFAWAIDAMPEEERLHFVKWITCILDSLYLPKGRENRERLIADEVKYEKNKKAAPGRET